MRHFIRWSTLFNSRLVSSYNYCDFDIFEAKNPKTMPITGSAATIHGATKSWSFDKIVLTATVHIEIPPIKEVTVASLHGLNGDGLIVQSSFFPSVIMPDILLCGYGISRLPIVMKNNE